MTRCRCTPDSHLREIAVHDEDKAGPRCLVWMVACDDCAEGREWHERRERSVDDKGKDRKPGRPITRLSAMLEDLRRASGSMRELTWYGRFLAACQAAETRAKAGTPATVTAFPRPAAAPRLTVVPDLDPRQADALNRAAWAMIRKAREPAPLDSDPDREPGWEARRRAEVAAQAEQLARRAGGGR